MTKEPLDLVALVRLHEELARHAWDFALLPRPKLTRWQQILAYLRVLFS